MSDPYNGNDRPRPTYGQSANEAQGQYSPYGQQVAPGAQGSNQNQGVPQYSQGGQQYQQQNQYSQPQYTPQTQQGAFGGYGTPYGYGGAAAKPKQKPIGIVLTLIGIVLMIISAILTVVAVWQFFGGAFNEIGNLSNLDKTNSKFENGTATYDFEVDGFEIMVLYVPEEDGENATCKAVLEDGTELQTQTDTSDSEGMTIDGKKYVPYKDSFFAENLKGKGTLTCENVSAPVSVMGPINVFNMFTNSAGWGIGALATGLIGGFLFFVGVIVMIVRAIGRSRN
ncbi:hypothetical protein M3B90_06520 [Dermabacter sp. p3-SID358]|uniref:hypothetical protein n=1 Tax=Dermabacter sp. p3-SID358 TaxID=2916114 RepID=UPI0021A77F3E|nr:hypothetical protein [Dermabacter sp. p3-SID358]MCT1867175.1 hypothetical protein [Dermabacter sp. p3-SID358]